MKFKSFFKVLLFKISLDALMSCHNQNKFANHFPFRCIFFINFLFKQSSLNLLQHCIDLSANAIFASKWKKKAYHYLHVGCSYFLFNTFYYFYSSHKILFKCLFCKVFPFFFSNCHVINISIFHCGDSKRINKNKDTWLIFKYGLFLY